MDCVRCFCLLIVLVSSGLDANADWPGLLGPSRNGIASPGSELPKTLDAQPKQIWAVEAGQGYAGPAVAGDDFVLFERIGENDRVRLLSLETGKEVWRRELKAGYRGGVDSDRGPRSVPTILDDSILVYSAAGELTLLDRKSGSVKWTRPLRKEYQAEDGFFGAGSTPLVVDNQVIVNIGGKSAGAVSVSLEDGKTIWTSPAAEDSYASPILLTPKEGSAITSPIVLVPSKQKTFGVDLAKGSLVWDFPFGQRGPTVNAATPVTNANGDVFLTSSYEIGSLLVRPGPADAGIVARGTEISSQYSTPIVIGDKIFGSDGREDRGERAYKCLQASDGKLLWEQPNMPICHSIGIGGTVLIAGIDGQIWAIDSSADTFRTLWKTELPRGMYRALPAFSGNRLYVRTSNGTGDKWYCFQIGG
ncbi:MAG: PQQ-like beta-propeller repeat protein [Planctomycetota bacterium]|nr:PQQ-like beta-propeller repeat protein [Planctomycetota bacterium]